MLWNAWANLFILYLYFSIHCCDEHPCKHCTVHAQWNILVMLSGLLLQRQVSFKVVFAEYVWIFGIIVCRDCILYWYGEVIVARTHVTQDVQGCFLFFFLNTSFNCFAMISWSCALSDWLVSENLVTPYVNWNSHSHLLCRSTQIIMIRRSLPSPTPLPHTTHTCTLERTHASPIFVKISIQMLKWMILQHV